jgi:hypothetical protein
VLFQFNPKFEILWKQPDVIKTIGNKSLGDIERKVIKDNFAFL